MQESKGESLETFTKAPKWFLHPKAVPSSLVIVLPSPPIVIPVLVVLLNHTQLRRQNY